MCVRDKIQSFSILDFDHTSCAAGFTFGEDASGVYHLLFSSKINVLLLSLPAGWACHFIKVPDVATFTLVSPQVFWSMSDSSRRSHCEHLRHIVRPLMQQSCFEMTCKVQNLVALIPLAWLLGWTTEDLSKRCGPVAGGLINATFGNAPELILSIIALLHGLPTVALASLLGSVLSNLLLVLGNPSHIPFLTFPVLCIASWDKLGCAFMSFKMS